MCPSSYTPITTAAECAAAAAASVAVAAAAGIATTAYGGVMPSIPSISTSGSCTGQLFIGALYPMGCFYYSTGICMAVGVWFNPDPVGKERSSGRLLCKLRGTAAPTNVGDTNAPTTAAPTAAPTLSTTLIAWHDTRRCLLCARRRRCTAALRARLLAVGCRGSSSAWSRRRRELDLDRRVRVALQFFV